MKIKFKKGEEVSADIEWLADTPLPKQGDTINHSEFGKTLVQYISWDIDGSSAACIIHLVPHPNIAMKKMSEELDKIMQTIHETAREILSD